MTATEPTSGLPKIKAHWVDIVEAAHAKIAPLIASSRTTQVTGMLEQFEADIGPLIAPIVQKLLDDPTTPAHLLPLLQLAAQPEHFGESIVIGIAVGTVLGPVLGAAIAPEVQVIANNAWKLNADSPLSPDLLAAATIKGVAPNFDKVAEAAFSGTNAERFGIMTDTAGQSIGTEEALLLLRRRQIGEAEFERIIRYSNVRNDFIPDIKLLQYAPPSVGEVITGALKHHLDDTTAQAYMSDAGIDPKVNYAWMKAAAGRPPGIEQIIHLWNLNTAGVLNTGVDEATVDAAVEQSDINDTYLPAVKMLRHYFPPPRSIIPMLRSGGINEAEARQLLTAYGVGEPWATAFVTEAHTTKTSTAKELSLSQVTRLLEGGFITPAEATARLTTIGYPADQITLLLDLATTTAEEKLQTALMSKIRTLYVGHKIDKPAATTALTEGKIPGPAMTQAFAIWDIERTASVHHPTIANVVGAYRRADITAAETKTRLTDLGVQQADLFIIVADGWPPTHAADGKAAALLVENA